MYWVLYENCEKIFFQGQIVCSFSSHSFLFCAFFLTFVFLVRLFVKCYSHTLTVFSAHISQWNWICIWVINTLYIFISILYPKSHLCIGFSVSFYHFASFYVSNREKMHLFISPLGFFAVILLLKDKVKLCGKHKRTRKVVHFSQ